MAPRAESCDTPSSMQIQPTPLSAPLVVSVTGHRDSLDETTLETTFQTILNQLSQEEKVEAGNCLLLTGLAEGADTLAARVALKSGWKVVAPLPLPPDEYRRDFQGAALDELNALLEKCPHFFVGYAPGRDADNKRCDEENTKEYGEFRNRQYAYLGEFLTRHCEVLVAFWDGNPSQPDKPGGTPDVVTMQQEGVPAHLTALRRDGTLLDSPEGGRTIQIWTARKSHQKSGLTLRETDRKHGQSEELRVDTNGQTPEHRQARRSDWQKFVASANLENPHDPYEAIPLDLAETDSYLFSVRDAYLRADALAGRLQRDVDKWFRRVLFVGGAFTFCIAGAGAFLAQSWSLLLLVASWGFLLLAIGFVQLEKRSERGNRRQDYRALSEAWRVCFFWRAVGITEPLDASYLRYQRGELDWIRHALRTHDLQWRIARPDCAYPSATTQGFEAAFANWISSQTKYFGQKYPGHRIRLTRLRNWSWALLIFGLCANAVAILAGLHADVNFAASDLGAKLWHFVVSFVSADLLSSPLVPAALALSRMGGWPLATEKNTQDTNAETEAETRKRRDLRRWFMRQSALWRCVAVFSTLAMAAIFAAISLGILPDVRLVPFLKMIATICFFLPALIFVEADFHALPEHVKNYERMFSIFERAKKMLEQIASVSPSHQGQLDWNDENVQDIARRIYLELGREALHENGEWLLIHRERPLDIEA